MFACLAGAGSGGALGAWHASREPCDPQILRRAPEAGYDLLWLDDRQPMNPVHGQTCSIDRIVLGNLEE